MEFAFAEFAGEAVLTEAREDLFDVQDVFFKSFREY